MNIPVTIILAAILRESTGDYSTRVIGGHDAADGKFAYQAAIGPGYQSCGGSILNKRWILTAGHCIYQRNPSDLIVRVGSNSIHVGGQIYLVDFTVIHELYVPSPVYSNDIGLVHVKEDFHFDEKVQSISLAESDFTKPNDTVIFAGWGSMKYNASSVDRLQAIDLKIIPFAACKRDHPTVTRRQICTLTKIGQGLCYGDSGGPLVAENGTQVGIASFGEPCARGYPDVFVRVYKYIDWIKRSIEENE